MADPHIVKQPTTIESAPVALEDTACTDTANPKMCFCFVCCESRLEAADELRKAKRREQQRRRRARETEEKATERRAKDAAAHSLSRKAETEEQKKERRKKDAAYKKRKLEAETPEEAERRRGIYREHMRLIWGTGTRKEEIRQLIDERSYLDASGKEMVLTDECRKYNRKFSYNDEGQQPMTKEEILELKKRYATNT